MRFVNYLIAISLSENESGCWLSFVTHGVDSINNFIRNFYFVPNKKMNVSSGVDAKKIFSLLCVAYFT